MNNNEIVSLIDEYLKSFPDLLKSRGLKIFENNICTFEIADNYENYYFEVEGKSKALYNVAINFEDNFKQINGHCECIYFEENQLCKHFIACLYYIKTYYGIDNSRKSKVSKSDKSQKKQNIKQPIKVKIEKEEEIDNIQNTELLDFIPASFLEKHEEVKLLPDKLEVAFSSHTFSNNIMDEKAWITYNNNCYYLECNNSFHKGICDHIKWLAAFLRHYEHLKILKYIKSDIQRELYNSMLDKMGIKYNEDEWKELFEMEFNGQNFEATLKGRIRGLIGPNTAAEFINDNVLSKFSTPEKKQELVFSGGEKISEKDNFQLIPAFVFMYDKEAKKLQKILSICGKPNKDLTSINSHIKILESPYKNRLIKSDNFDQLFFLKESINQVLKNEESIFEEQFLIHLNQFGSSLKNYCTYITYIHNYFLDNFITPVTPAKSQLVHIEHIYCWSKLKFSLFKENDLYTLKAFIELDNQHWINVEDIHLLDDYIFLYHNSIGILNSIKESEALRHFWYKPELKIIEKNIHQFLDNVVHQLAEEFVVNFEPESIPKIHQSMEVQEKRLYISELNNFVIFRPCIYYKEDKEVNVLEESTPFTSGDQLILYQRDMEAEENYLEELAQIHRNFNPQTRQSFFYLTFDEFKKDHWFLTVFEFLKEKDIKVYGYNKLKNFNFNLNTPSVNMGIRSKQDWFETEIDVAFGDNKVSTYQIKKAVMKNSPYVELTDGTYGIIPEEWMRKFSTLFRAGKTEKNSIKVSKTRFNSLDEIVSNEDHPHILKEIQEKKEKLKKFSGIKNTPTPSKLHAELRNYQKEGLNWLNFLHEYEWGGILADDMGLGKTLQALGLICLEAQNKPKMPNLVVAPTTLLFNWKSEINKFAPDIDYVVHHGQRYDNFDELKNHQLILTSYGIIINDLDLLKKINFNLIIADESQAIKNINSQRFKALTKLKGKIRLAMTGTPVENNIFELYAQMTFANPGFFHGLSHFKDNYAKPIQQYNDKKITDELKKQIKPFIMRRTKEEVLTELPDKTEEYLYCQMPEEQRKVYDAYRNDYRNYLLNKVDEEGVENAQLHILQGLTRLRQICDSPALIEEEGIDQTESAKIDELLRQVREKTGNHKILVFSQFVSMLKLLSNRFDKEDVNYIFLDGSISSKEREKRVGRFQEDPECRVFLISLKAGGTGLNLTAADYVYIVDPWWNPAVENQAIDRCYRIGQKKKVFAYRMICKNTVEEKILELQRTKKSLSEDVIGESNNLANTLDKEDIKALFD